MALGDGPTPVRRATWPSARPTTPDLAERVGEAIGLEARAMGVNVVYAPVLDVATNPANAGPRDPLVRRRPGRASRRSGRRSSRGLQAGRRGRRGQALPGSWRHGRDTHHGLAIVRGVARAARGRRAACRSGRRSRPGARLVMSSHVAVPAPERRRRGAGHARAGGHDRPAPRPSSGSRASRSATRSTWARSRQGEAQAAADRRRAPGRRRPAAVRARSRRPGRASRRRCVAAAEDGHIDAVAGRRAPGPDRRAARVAGHGRRRRRTSTSSAAPTHAALARELAERSLTLVRDDARRAARWPLPGGCHHPRRDARRRPTSPRPTPRRRSRPALAAALCGPGRTVDELVTSRRARPTPTIAAVRDRARTPRTPSSIGTIDGLASRASSRCVEAVAAAAARRTGPSSRSRCATPWDVAVVPGRRPAVVHLLDPARPRCVRARGALSGAIPFAGRLPVRVDRGVAVDPRR